MTIEIARHQSILREQPEDGSSGLNVARLWSYLCSVGALTKEPDITSLARVIPKADLLTMNTPDDWAVTTLVEIPDMAWAWQLPAAFEVMREIDADEAISGPLNAKLRTFTGRFGRILTEHESPYVDLAELVMERLEERKQAARAAADIAAGR